MTPRRPIIRQLLTLCVSASAIASASHVHSEVSSLLDVTPDQFCERWRDNALLGARQQLRGASREEVQVRERVDSRGDDDTALKRSAKGTHLTNGQVGTFAFCEPEALESN